VSSGIRLVVIQSASSHVKYSYSSTETPLLSETVLQDHPHSLSSFSRAYAHAPVGVGLRVPLAKPPLEHRVQ
jgi:hypothetical protein